MPEVAPVTSALPNSVSVVVLAALMTLSLSRSVCLPETEDRPVCSVCQGLLTSWAVMDVETDRWRARPGRRRSPPQFRHPSQPAQLLRVADRIDPGDPA